MGNFHFIIWGELKIFREWYGQPSVLEDLYGKRALGLGGLEEWVVWGRSWSNISGNGKGETDARFEDLNNDGGGRYHRIKKEGGNVGKFKCIGSNLEDLNG